MKGRTATAPRAMMSMGVVAVLGGVACAGSMASEPIASHNSPKSNPAAPPGPVWIVTESARVTFPLAGGDLQSVDDAHEVPVLFNGIRTLLRSGRVIRYAPRTELTGFRAAPSERGGGFMMWSSSGLYRADEFTGPLEPIASLGGIELMRPYGPGWFIRARLGSYFLSPAGELSPFEHPGMVDAQSFADGESLMVDALLRLYRGASGSDLQLVAHDRPVHRLDADTVRWARPGSAVTRPLHQGEPDPPEKRWLARASLEPAIAAGLRLEDHSWVVPQPDRRFTIMADMFTEEESVPNDATLVGFECGATAGRPGILIACSDAVGAVVLTMLDANGGGQAEVPATLEATFPPTEGFVDGGGGRLASLGRCGGSTPSVADLGRSVHGSPGDDDAFEAPDARELRPYDRVLCARTPSGWIERTVHGEEAERIVRWAVGPDGTATALWVRPSESSEAVTEPTSRLDKSTVGPPTEPVETVLSEGVALVELDVDDLRGARLARPANEISTIDRDFWTTEDGHVHGWMEWPSDEFSDFPSEAEAQEMADTELMVDARGGPALGITIAPDGTVSLHRPPEHTFAVARGGPDAIAFHRRDEQVLASETRDGGRSWRPIELPPFVAPSSALGNDKEIGCSFAGCSFGLGVVRLGWGPRAGASADVRSAEVPSVEPVPHRGIRMECTGMTGASVAYESSKLAGLWRRRPGPWQLASRPFRPELTPIVLHRNNVTAARAAFPVLVPGGGVELGVASEGGEISSSAFPNRSMNAEVHRWAREPDGAVQLGQQLLVLDANTLGLVAGKASSPWLRVPSSSTLHLAVRGSELGLIGHESHRLDSWVASVDLPNLSIGTIKSLASLSALQPLGSAECPSQRSDAWASVIPAQIDLRLVDQAGADLFASHQVAASLWVQADEHRMCLLGLEAELTGAVEHPLSLRFSANGVSARIGATKSAAPVCKVTVGE